MYMYLKLEYIDSHVYKYNTQNFIRKRLGSHDFRIYGINTYISFLNTMHTVKQSYPIFDVFFQIC